MKRQGLSKFGRNGLAVGIVGLSLAYAAQGGVPLNNLQGVGGVAFNPLAYPAGQNKGSNSWEQVISKPQVGSWYVHLNESDINWNAIGGAVSLFDRLELSYGYEAIAISGGPSIDKNNIGAKLNLVPENAGGYGFVPALSVGTIWKQTSKVLVPGADDKAFDFYLVATKLITQTPLPVLVSGGLLSSKEYVTGVAGFDSDSKITGFANVEVILPYGLALGGEFKQGEKYATFENANYWDVSLAWMATKNLTLAVAYVDTGKNQASPFGLGSGTVLSAQYAF
ncbi:MAG: DUF3034 family protein [bacterium]